MLLGHERPTRGLEEYEHDRENLLSLAREIVDGNKSVKETAINEMRFWYKCKLCLYKGSKGDLYQGSELFGRHIKLHHRISITFYVNRFLKGQEIFIEHTCEGKTGMLEPVPTEEED